MENSLTQQERAYLELSKVVDHLVSTTMALNALDMTPAKCEAQKANIENALLELNTAPLPPHLAAYSVGDWTMHINDAAINCIHAMDKMKSAIEQCDPDLASEAAHHMRGAGASFDIARQLVRFD